MASRSGGAWQRPLRLLRTPLLVALFTAGPARADHFRSESSLWLRHDLLGENTAPVSQLLSFDRGGPGLSVDGYLGLDWAWNVGAPLDPDIYQLALGGRLGRLDWGLGRQQGLGALRPQTFDGLRVEAPVAPSVTVAAWAGLARRQDLDDLVDQATMARVEARFRAKPLLARLGAQVESGPLTPTLPRQDLDLRLRPLRRATLDGRLVLAEPLDEEPPRVEWASLESTLTPWSALDLGASLRHREAADPTSLFGDAILGLLGDGGVDEIGARLGVRGARWSSLSTRAALLRSGPDDERVYGYKVDLSYRPARTDRAWALEPAFSSTTGPGGQAHTFWMLGSLDPSDRTHLHATAALIPFQRPAEAWLLLGAAAAEARRDLARGLEGIVRGDVVAGGDRDPELRVGLSLVMERP